MPLNSQQLAIKQDQSVISDAVEVKSGESALIK